MRPRRLDLGRGHGTLTTFSACILLVNSGKTFAQSNNTSRELPPIEVSGGETPRHKKPATPRRASKPTVATRQVAAQPAPAPAADVASVASGAKGAPSMASGCGCRVDDPATSWWTFVLATAVVATLRRRKV